MLFNSYLFVFCFLPVVVIGYYALGSRQCYRLALGWLVLASAVFYGWWNPIYLILILSSIVFNFTLGWSLRGATAFRKQNVRRILLVLGIATNLVALAYFKYANFFVNNLNALLETDFHLEKIILPLAISFFTFQQITYLVDTYKGITEEHNLLQYCLFVTFFPQLIAGPIVHHREMLPQFADRGRFLLSDRNVAIGVSIFVIGLTKKVGIADTVAVYANPVFSAAAAGESLTFFEAWGGALAYTFQLYFDFSGYSDMAVGLAYMFGIRLPLNFFSPYKAVNIVEFWRRWHITLSRFLRDYVYIPLGGNRRGRVRRHINLLTTMLLGGLWHGAAWTFVFWGAFHGVLLIVNHAWTTIRRAAGFDRGSSTSLGQVCGRFLTFLAVVVGWVLFRAETFQAAEMVLQGMSGLNGLALPSSYQAYFNYIPSLGDWLSSSGIRFDDSAKYFSGLAEVVCLLVALVLTWFAPNTHRLMGKQAPALDITHVSLRVAEKPKVVWAPNLKWAALVISLLIWCIFGMDRTSEFLYYQF